MRQKCLCLAIVLVFLDIFSGNAQEKSGKNAPIEPPVGPPSLYILLNAAEGGSTAWRPDWPTDMPPDLFVTNVPALSIIAEFEDGTRLEYTKDANGRVLSFPLLLRVTNNSGKADTAAGKTPQTGTAVSGTPDSAALAESLFFQGRCEYDRQGRLLKIFWKGQSDEESSDAEALQWDDDKRPLLWRIWSGDYYFTALEYAGDSLIETWYNRDGNALFIIITEGGKQTTISGSLGGQGRREETIFYYNSWGLVSGIETPDGNSASALYNEFGRPVYLKKNDQTLVYSWDGAGKLVQLGGSLGSQGNLGSQGSRGSRYEYTLDSRGNWTTRKEFSMNVLGPEDGSRLVTSGGRSIRRTIRYGEGGK